MGFTVAVAGATGAVGTEMLSVLARRKFPADRVIALASERSVGKQVRFKEDEVEVQVLCEDSFEGVDIALFSAGADRSRRFAPAAVERGAVVVDNSSAFRMDPEVPLVVPEINPQEVANHKGIIANPNCSTIIAVVAVWPLHCEARLRRMIASTYQAASGAGAKAMAELERQVNDIIAGRAPSVEVFPHQIAFNLFPHVDVFLENAYTREEMKMAHETRKIFGDETLRISATCVRVPIYRAHSEALNLEFERDLSPERARELLEAAPGVRVVDDPANNSYPMPLDATGEYDVLVGRIRRDESCENTLDIWVSGDQILKGAALNAVQIAELLAGGED